MNPLTESIQLTPGLCLQAFPQKFLLHRQWPLGLAPGLEHPTPIGSAEVTRQLMAGAFYAGLPQGGIPTSRPGLSLLRYLHSLAASFQTTHATPPTMRRVAQRLSQRGRNAEAAYCAHVADEEAGHDTLALMDLAALGLPAEPFVARLRPPNAAAMVTWFQHLADSDAPITVLGYAYALERGALFIREESIGAIEQLIPAGIQATRCLRVHSAASPTETRHLAESLAFIATLSPNERAAIARAAYQTVQLQFSAPDDYPGDEAMQALLDDLGAGLEPMRRFGYSPDAQPEVCPG